MALTKKKYETIECSNEHIFRLEYEGTIKVWKCVVLEDEVVTYEADVETGRLKITDKTNAPQVLQIDTVATIYGEQIPFQLECGAPFLKLEGEWVPSDTFAAAKREAAAKMYRRQAKLQIGIGIAMLVGFLAIWLLMGTMGDLWIISVFGMFFISSGGFTWVRVRNELQAYQDAEEEEAARANSDEVDAIAAARALHAGKTEE